MAASTMINSKVTEDQKCLRIGSVRSTSSDFRFAMFMRPSLALTITHGASVSWQPNPLILPCGHQNMFGLHKDAPTISLRIYEANHSVLTPVPGIAYP
jgi:hypothetical protein